MQRGAATAADTPAGDAAAKAANTAKSVCAACHGADGNSAASTFPKLAGQQPAYIVKQLSNFKDGSRDNPVMKPIASSLSTEDMQALAAYFASQKSKDAGAKTNGPGSLGEKIYRGGIAANRGTGLRGVSLAERGGYSCAFPASGRDSMQITHWRSYRRSVRVHAAMGR